MAFAAINGAVGAQIERHVEVEAHAEGWLLRRCVLPRLRRLATEVGFAEPHGRLVESVETGRLGVYRLAATRSDEPCRQQHDQCDYAGPECPAQPMEKWILQYPEQYLWIHKRFKGQVDYSSSLPWEL